MLSPHLSVSHKETVWICTKYAKNDLFVLFSCHKHCFNLSTEKIEAVKFYVNLTPRNTRYIVCICISKSLLKVCYMHICPTTTFTLNQQITSANFKRGLKYLICFAVSYTYQHYELLVSNIKRNGFLWMKESKISSIDF